LVRDNQTQPSFPTRRSSDLIERGDVSIEREIHHPEARHDEPQSDSEEGRETEAGEENNETLREILPQLAARDHLDRGVGHGRRVDRKSTRLNSSHQIISYAV